jgi:hypothetical protein
VKSGQYQYPYHRSFIMMSKILFLGLLLSTIASAQDASEEAIILNNELQFLEDSAKDVDIISTSTSAPSRSFDRASQGLSAKGESLEDQYFTDTKEDEVSSRKAAPKRRGY